MTDDKRGLQGLKVGVAGCGNMGGAIAMALCRSGKVPPDHLWLLDKAEARADALAAELGANVARTGTELAEAADIVVIAVKPNDVVAFLRGVVWTEAPRVVVSVAAGLRVAMLQEVLPQHVRIVRTMPNTPVMVGAGTTAVLRSADEVATSRALAIFESCGEVVMLRDEDQFSAVTALSGSGPAYIFVMAEAMADGGVKMGLPRDVAQKLALSTIRGAAELVLVTGKHPAELKDAVASPGGTTIHALAALERGGFRAALIDAVVAATRRGDAMG